MSPIITRCKVLLALAVWVCVCLLFIAVCPSLPSLHPPIPATSPRPPQPQPQPPPPPPHIHHSHLYVTQNHIHAATVNSRTQRIWQRANTEAKGDDVIYNDEEDDEEYNENEDMTDGDYNYDDENDHDLGNKIDDSDDDYFYEEDDEGGANGDAKTGHNNDGEIGTDAGEGYKVSEYTYDESDDGDGGGQYDVVEYTGGEYNVTPSSAHLLIYNRIPKCASSTMQTVLRWCSRRLGFQHVSSEVYDQHQLTKNKRQELVRRLTTNTTATSYDRHLYYIDFNAEGAERPPVYVNIVREPAERFISSFYYRRSKERLARISANGHLTIAPSINWLNRTVEQCVMSGDLECSFTNGTKQEMILTYFCGHQEYCRTVGSEAALQMAKQVVSRRYSVVGLVEHMETTLRLMQTLVPSFFAGAFDSYLTIRKKEEKVNKNTHKPTVSKETWMELRRRMANDIDLYNFLKQRLFLQAKTFLGE